MPQYLGSFIGSAQYKEEWLGELVAKWVDAVVMLSTIAERYPQTAYAGFTLCLQNGWQYIQQVVADTAPFFLPPKAAICTCFLPALLGVPFTEVNGEYQQLLTRSVKLGGLGTHNPVSTALSVHGALLAATHHLAKPRACTEVDEKDIN